MIKLKKKDKKKLIIFIIAGFILLASGITALILFNSKTEEAGKTIDQEASPVVEEKKKVKIVNEDSKSRPYAVMINNNSAVWRYQSGMNQAVLVYEMLVEGGITREMAVFKDSNAEKIQSIRSSRHYFLDYALENDAIYVHWGYSPRAQTEISSMKVNNINGLTYEGSYFFRDKTITGVGMEHKGYTTMEHLKKATERLKYRTETDKGNLLKYDAESIDLTTKGTPVDAKYVEIPYSGSYKARFFYDEETKMYKRSQNKTELIDYNSKERVITKNIIVYNVGYTTMDSYGRQDMQNTGSGTGYLISEGKAVEITWEKASRESRTKYKYKDGSELVVNDGITYIGLQPKGRTPLINAELPA